jgi:hypothetical protein
MNVKYFMPTVAIMRRLSTETFLSTRFILDSSPLAAPSTPDVFFPPRAFSFQI